MLCNGSRTLRPLITLSVATARTRSRRGSTPMALLMRGEGLPLLSLPDSTRAGGGKSPGKIPPTSHADGLGWFEARLNLKSLLSQVEQSTGRIAELVKAIRSYSYMDQSPMQEIDIHEGIESTLTMLGHKLKNVTVVRAFDRCVPRIMAYGSELNQVWTNLIDNAIHAVNGAGKICIGTSLEDNQLVVEIVDNGSGIPSNVQPHLFEPFFTTKPVGTGTGLGLVISNRIVGDRHGGEIEFESRPGETRFKVRLPLNRTPAASTVEVVRATESLATAQPRFR